MDIEILRKIGLTEGEIKVYKSLIKIGKSSTGPIMKNSAISSSKVYLILEKLIQKGLVSFIIENNVKKFQASSPKTILDYINKKKEDLEKTKREAQSLVLELTQTLGIYEEESAQIYKGFAGMRVVFQNVLDEFDKGEEMLFFGVSPNEFVGKTEVFFDNFHAKRIEKEIRGKIILDLKLKSSIQNTLKKRKLYQVKFYKLSLPQSIVIGKNRIVLALWEENPIAFEIISKRAVERYKEYFESIWKKSSTF